MYFFFFKSTWIPNRRKQKGPVATTLHLADFMTTERDREILKETMESAARFTKKAEEERNEKEKVKKKTMAERKKILEEKNKLALENEAHRETEKETRRKASETALHKLVQSRKRIRTQK